MAASSLPKEGCSWRSNTRRKRCTACTDTVRRRTVSAAACKKKSGKLQIAGFGPGIAASFHAEVIWGGCLPLPGCCQNYDVIYETDHLVNGPLQYATGIHQENGYDRRHAE